MRFNLNLLALHIRPVTPLACHPPLAYWAHVGHVWPVTLGATSLQLQECDSLLLGLLVCFRLTDLHPKV